MELSSYAKDQAISALLESGNYKQAIKNIDKKLKKTPKDRTLNVLKACALFEAGEHTESSKICGTFVAAKDVDTITDPDLLSLLYYTLCKLAKVHGQGDLKLAETLWQNAIKSLSEKRVKVTVAQRWASEALNHDEWTHFVKAANALSKLPDAHSSVPARSYYFWQAVGYHLVSRQNTGNSLIAQTNGKISVKMLTDALDKIPDGQEHTQKPGQWISNLSEFGLLYYILSEHQKLPEIRSILEGDPAKRVLHSEFEIACFKFHTMVKLQAKEEWSWETVQALIGLAIKNNHDWMMEDTAPWTVLLELCRNRTDRDHTCFQKFQDSLSKVSGLIPRSRSLRYIEYQFEEIKSAQKVPNGTPVPSSTIKGVDPKAPAAYFKNAAHQTYVINDLREDIRKMTPDQFKDFRSSINQNSQWKDFSKEMSSDDQLKWLVYETNILSADFLYLQGSAESKKDLPSSEYYQDAIQQLVSNSIRLYKLSKCHTAAISLKDSRPGDTSCRIAASGLVCLGSATEDSRYTVQAACLLAYLLEDSPYDFRGRLAYIQLLRQMNIYSLAWKAYEFLEVKEVLHEDLGPELFARISTSHPTPTKSFNAYMELAKPLKFYRSSIAKLPNFQEMALEHGNYESVVRLVEFAERLQKSVSRNIFIAERRRIARLLDKTYDKFDSSPEFSFPSSRLDIRKIEMEAFSTAESSPVATSHYADYLIILDEVHNLLYLSQNLTTENVKTVRTHLEVFQTTEKEESSGIFKEEYDAIARLGLIVDLCDELCNPGKPDVDTLHSKFEALRKTTESSKCIEVLKAYQAEQVIKTSFASRKFFHLMYLQLEFLQASHRLCDRVLECIKVKFGKKMTDLTRAIQENAKAAQLDMKDQAEQCKRIASNCRNILSNHLNNDDFVRNILGPEDENGTIAHEIYKLMGYQNAKRILGDMARGALESYDGVLSVKVGSYA